MTEPSPRVNKTNMMTLPIKDKKFLYLTYMPFVDKGGLFIPTKRDVTIGDTIFLLVTFFEETEKVPISGHVIWKTPEQAENNKPRGFGIQFDGNDKGAAKLKIETALAGAADSKMVTYTM